LGIIGRLFEKEEKKKHSLGVCIPDAGKRKKGSVEEEEMPRPGRAFLVKGIFHVQDSIMLQGRPLGGSLEKGAKVEAQGLKFSVKDVQVDGKSVDKMGEGQKGALFLKPEDSAFPIIKIGDLLEF